MKIPMDWKIVILVALIGVGCLVASSQMKRQGGAVGQAEAGEMVR